jgi:hypothetical protein
MIPSLRRQNDELSGCNTRPPPAEGKPDDRFHRQARWMRRGRRRGRKIFARGRCPPFRPHRRYARVVLKT